MTSEVQTKEASLSLLCIDDDPQVLVLLKTLLEHEPGFAVETSTSALEALDLLTTQQYDAILSDYYMPDMDGISLLREVRSRGISAPFVIFTGRHIARVAIDTLNNGGNFYIQKGPEFLKDIPKLVAFLRSSHKFGIPGQTITQSVTEAVKPDRVQNIPETGFARHQDDILFSITPDGAFTFINDAYARVLGLQEGMMPEDTFFSKVPDSQLGDVLETLATLNQDRPACYLEHEFIPPGDVPFLISCTYRAIFDDEGNIHEYQVLGRPEAEVIKLWHAPSKPVESEPIDSRSLETAAIPEVQPKTLDLWKEFADSIENLQYPIFIVDTEGVVKAWNSALGHLTGVYAHEIIGKSGREYAVPFYGEPRPMLIDYLIPSREDRDAFPPTIRRDGDAYIGAVESIVLNGKALLMGGRATAIHNSTGEIVGAVQSILVSEHQATGTVESLFEDEQYIGGISSVILKVTGKGLGGAIAGAIGAATGGFGVYATNQRLFVVYNPDLDAARTDGIQFGTFIVDELFGTNVDIRPRSIRELERLKVFEVWRKDITSIEMKKPRLLAGFLVFKTRSGESFRIYIDHQKAFIHIEQLLQLFAPEVLEDKTQTIDDSDMGWMDEINTYDLVGNLKIEDPLKDVAATASDASGFISPRKPSLAAAAPGTWTDLRLSIEPLQYPIFAIDTTGKVVAWNKAVADLTGTPASAVLGRGNHAYSIPFYGKMQQMLIDYIIMPPDAEISGSLPNFTREGDTFIGDLEKVIINNKPMLLWGKGTGIYDPKGTLVAAIQSILVREQQPPKYADEDLFEEQYIGGISSITVKMGREGAAGAIAGAIGSATGGYGVYATDQRLFIIHNPELDATKPDGLQFGTFIMDELFGTTVDIQPRTIEDLEARRVYEISRKDLAGIEIKKPMLLAGHVIFRAKSGEAFRIYIDHKRAFIHLDQILRLFYPDILTEG